MARYTHDSLERVRDAVDFAELVGARTELRAAGPRRMTGLCPFHEERTPSFGIDPVEKLYHCFGCGAGGDVFTFVMETEGLDFAGALESLAERAGIELEREAEDPQEARRRERRERLLALLERTAAYYVRVLWESAEAAPAREYLTGRGLEESALREFRVGWSPGAWDRVLSASQRAGYSEAELLASGLVSRGRDGRGVFDRFRGRIMFPLADERGRVLGFGARALAPDQQPKYLNTSEGELFHKGRMVYGADLARAAAARAARVVLVEGYTDVIALRQAGVPEAVCSMGTALTPEQAHALRRLAPSVLFCQDPDTAGQEAVAKALEVMRRGGGLEARVVRLPPGRDPADVVQQDGPDAIRALLDGAVPVERFQVERALERGELDDAGGPRPGAGRGGPDDRAAGARAAAGRPHPAGRQPAGDVRERHAGRAAARAARRRDGGGGGQRPPGRGGDRPDRDLRRQARGRRAGVPRALPRRQGRGPRRRSRRWTSTPRSPPTWSAAPRTTCPSTSSTRARGCRPAPTTSPAWSPSWSSAPASSPPTATRSRSSG